ncbi:MAG: hypothetical protein K2X87_08700 [Gemmataceae bacterium]|nr:hypothetical protein [Gemmataceae bacterium]
MRTRSFFAAVTFVGLAGVLAAAPPDRSIFNGKVKWAEKHPKAYPAEADGKPGVLIFGTYETPKGWTAKSVELSYWPKDGGLTKSVEGIKLDGGKFGMIDPKTKKVVPFKAETGAGGWNLLLVVTYERKENGETAEEVPVAATLTTLEVK